MLIKFKINVLNDLMLKISQFTVKAHVVLTCTNAVSPNHFLAIVASDRP